MSSKNPASIVCLALGLPLLSFGIYFVVWSIVNHQFDEYIAFGILMIIIGAVLTYGSKINQENDKILLQKCSIHPERDSVGKCAGCGSAFCADCLTEVSDAQYCPSCYDIALEKARDKAKEDVEFVSKIPLKSKTIALFLCVFLWLFGLHMFYLGYSSKGTARLIITLIAFGSLITPFGDIVLTITLFFKAIHAIIDLFSIAGNMRDAYGRKLV